VFSPAYLDAARNAARAINAASVKFTAFFEEK
jgi:hypothetical protein